MVTDVHHFTTTAPPACSCPDHLYRRERRPCKHVRRLAAAQQLLSEQATYNTERRTV